MVTILEPIALILEETQPGCQLPSVSFLEQMLKRFLHINFSFSIV